jgi:hypothetical protein
MKKAQIPAKTSLRHAAAAACAAAILMLCGCATPAANVPTYPTYRPQASEDGAGYADQQINATRYRVSFAGDTQTSRGQVEDFLLRRAAEITVGAGYNYFAFDNRTIESDTNLYRTNDNWDPANGLAFGLGRRYPGRAEHFAKGSTPAFWSEKEAVPITRYTARSEIIMLTPEQVGTHPDALAARAILKSLVPDMVTGTRTANAAVNP